MECIVIVKLNVATEKLSDVRRAVINKLGESETIIDVLDIDVTEVKDENGI